MEGFEYILLMVINFIAIGFSERESVSLRVAILSFFKSRNALSAETAVEMTDVDWLGGIGLRSQNITNMKFMSMFIYRVGIKDDGKGRYWLDLVDFEAKAKKYDQDLQNRMKIMIILSVIVFVGWMGLNFVNIFD